MEILRATIVVPKRTGKFFGYYEESYTDYYESDGDFIKATRLIEEDMISRYGKGAIRKPKCTITNSIGRYASVKRLG